MSPERPSKLFGQAPFPSWKLTLFFKRRLKIPTRFQILIVCSGNICRSPMAEGYLRFVIPPKYKNGVQIISAGTFGIEDAPPSAEAVEVMKEIQIEISGHRSRALNQQLVDRSDLILATSIDHYEEIQSLFHPPKGRLHLLGDFDSETPCRENSIPDPIGQQAQLFRECRNLIIRQIDKILPKILKRIDNHLKNP